jgi:hypothetical protein
VIVERPALERRILASLDAGRIPVLLGSCGSGRTSVLLRVAHQLGAGRGQYLDFAAAATTPERCLTSIAEASTVPLAVPGGAAPASPRAAFDTLFTLFDRAAATPAGVPTFLIDEFLDVRTFEHFPGLRNVQRDTVARLAASPSRFVLASRFTARTHRLLRDAPARFEVMHVPPLDAGETMTLALAHAQGRREWAAQVARPVTALAAGRPAYARLLLSTLVDHGASADPIGAMSLLFTPDGRLTARCRETYEFRLHRARGYGALKAILGILAADEPLTLTEIAHQLHRTPGSAKDYLSWLEDVDLLSARGKRYAFEDPVLRVFVRLYARPVPPSDADVVREVAAYANAVLPAARDVPATAAPLPVTAGPPSADPERTSGIIEID